MVAQEKTAQLRPPSMKTLIKNNFGPTFSDKDHKLGKLVFGDHQRIELSCSNSIDFEPSIDKYTV